MCIKTDMGFQTISSSFIALPSFKSKLNKNKPIFRHANGSPDSTSYDDLKIWKQKYEGVKGSSVALCN